MPEKTRKSITEQLIHSTVRIECTYNDGSTGYGTGFFYQYGISGEYNVPMIVTNKHVVRNSIIGKFQLTLDKNGDPDIGNYRQIEIDGFEKKFIFHPDNDIDLAVFPIAPVLKKEKDSGYNYYYSTFNNELLPNENKLSNLSAMEDVVMIGYPIGLWDSHNNLPIIRKGVTASHPKYDYDGRKEIALDIAAFPGSSGSPVLLLNEGTVIDHMQGIVSIGSRLILIGILYAGPQYDAEGKIIRIDIPTVSKKIIISSIPVNIGYAIKSEELLVFESIIQKQIRR